MRGSYGRRVFAPTWRPLNWEDCQDDGTQLALELKSEDRQPMNDAEGTSWLWCSECGSRFLAAWFRAGSRCPDIARGPGEGHHQCDGALLEYEEWKQQHHE
jgi:hypothetical protein